MHRVVRPRGQPEELQELRENGSEDFGPLASPLDAVFAGVCVYCERTTKDYDKDLYTTYFTCDHFMPRHLLCHDNPIIGRCVQGAPPHSNVCDIYEWTNLLYACRSCADAKGGQWPRIGDSADQYMDPCHDGDDDTMDSVFYFDVGSGRINVREDVKGTLLGNNAERTIGDLALNDPRGPRHQGTPYAAKERRIALSERRKEWVERFAKTLNEITAGGADLVRFVIMEHVDPSCRFSSICRQFVQDSDEYRHYL